MNMEEYSERLRSLVLLAKGEGTLRELARRMGDEGLRSSLSYWTNSILSRPLRGESYELLSRVDPHNRTPGEIEQWLKVGAQQQKSQLDEAVSILLLRRLLLTA